MQFRIFNADQNSLISAFCTADLRFITSLNLISASLWLSEMVLKETSRDLFVTSVIIELRAK